jgi:hypothetical protein
MNKNTICFPNGARRRRGEWRGRVFKDGEKLKTNSEKLNTGALDVGRRLTSDL